MRFSTILLLLTIVNAACSLSAQTSAVPEMQYHSVPDFLHLPADLYFGEVTGVAVNSKGHVFVFSRSNTTGPAYGAAAAQLLEFDRDGKFLREIGHNLYAWSYAHTVKIDPQDNIWVTTRVRMSSSSSLRKGKSPWFSVASRRRRMMGLDR